MWPPAAVRVTFALGASEPSEKEVSPTWAFWEWLWLALAFDLLLCLDGWDTVIGWPWSWWQPASFWWGGERVWKDRHIQVTWSRPLVKKRGLVRAGGGKAKPSSQSGAGLVLQREERWIKYKSKAQESSSQRDWKITNPRKLRDYNCP